MYQLQDYEKEYNRGTVIIHDRDIWMSEAEYVSLFSVITPIVRTIVSRL